VKNPLGEDYTWFRWAQVNEVDRGFDEVCWVHTNTHVQTLHKLYRQALGPRDSKTHVYMHLCERHGERNKCIRPGHVVIGTYSENSRHRDTLTRAAGKPAVSDEARRKMSEAHVGMRRSEASRKKQSATLRGRTLSEETKRKISESLKGHVLSEETKQKISETLRRRL